jgi:hypothetical protein
VARFCEHSNEPSSAIKDEIFLDQLSDTQFNEMDSVCGVRSRPACQYGERT